MNNVILHDPLWLFALLLIPLALWLRGRRAVPVLLVPFAAAWHRPSAASPSRWRAWLAALALALLAAALARPQRVEDKIVEKTEGYDLVLAIDLSGSMLAEDFERDGAQLNRLQVIKPVIESFIARRPNDRIGVVVFGEQAYTLAPLTFDHEWLAAQVARLKIGLVGPGRTAIGDGLGVALTRLEQSARESGGKRQGAVVVLLTDGSNNSGALDPLQAAAIAKSRAIPVYTIGAGRDGIVPMPIVNQDLSYQLDGAGRKIYRHQPSDLDEPALRAIAGETGGRFFRADDTRTVEEAFRAIDRAQKIEFEARSHLVTTELFPWLAAPGLACLALAALGARRPAALGKAPLAAAPASSS
jgi:Ca-activated chloride channel family protein